MSQAIDLTTNAFSESPGRIKRTAVLLYGIFSYTVGVTGLLWIILAAGGLAPAGSSPFEARSTVHALLINCALIALFGLQHSVMARPGFKNLLTKWLPEAAERSTFVLLSGLFLSLAIWLWQDLPGEIWVIESPAGRYLLWGLYGIGWTYLFAATFVTNHFELMGLRQVYLYFTGKPYTSLPFVRKYMYRYSRHPMMLGVLAGIWCVPAMSASHFVLSALLTLYIAIGVSLEERDLLERFGETYRAYKKEIASLIPGMF